MTESTHWYRPMRAGRTGHVHQVIQPIDAFHGPLYACKGEGRVLSVTADFPPTATYCPRCFPAGGQP